MDYKQRFFELLEEMFVGVEVKGDSGLVKLLDFKARYFKKLKKEIEEKIAIFGSLPHNSYDRLYTFFDSYFNESGSIFFANTPAWKKRYAKVSNKDVELFYKTKDLYYIKSQKTYNDLELEIDNIKIKFEVDLGDRNGNEKKNIEFFLKDKIDDTFIFLVKYKNSNKQDILKDISGKKELKEARAFILNELIKNTSTKLKINDKVIKFENNYIFQNLETFITKNGIADKFEFIIKENNLFDLEVVLALKNLNDIKKLTNINEETLQKAFKTFNKQSSIDYFIHKNAREFLKEQFDLYLYNYLTDENSLDIMFDEKYLKILQEIKEIAYFIIDKIADFEDELKAIYLKPRFVLDSNYVITKDRLEEYRVLDKFLENDGINEQIKEWKELKLVDEGFELSKIDDEKYKYLPFDTKYFKDIEIDLLEKIENLDDELDGRLIHSENFQALNTLLPKYKRSVDLVYIDPPYNAKSSEIDYINSFKSSSFLTFIENRVYLSRFFMKKNGVFFMAIDDYEIDKISLLLKEYFENLANITVVHNPSGRQDDKFFPVSHEYMLVYALDKDQVTINKLPKSEKKLNEFKYRDKYGKYKLREYRRSGSNSRREDGPGLWYPIYFYPKDKCLTTAKIPNRSDYIKLLPIDNNGVERCWRWSKDTFEKKKNKYIEIKKRQNDYVLYVKERESDYEGDKARTIWNDSKYASANGTNIIKNILDVDNKFFQFPKSVELIKDVLKIGSHQESLVLDFFAGSGTTADAVIRLNKEDNGNRKYILIEIGEHFDNVILPRIKKLCVSLNYKQGIPQDRDGNSLFFKYYKFEQFEDILKSAVYKDSLEISPRLSYATEIDLENEKLKYAFDKLYANIDLAETISNLIGKKIKKITKEKIILEDREIDLDDLTFEKYPELKPLIYWGEENE